MEDVAAVRTANSNPGTRIHWIGTGSAKV